MIDTFLRGPKVVINGYNGAIINATFEDICDQNSLMVMPTVAVGLEVASTDATNDVMTTGTGAWTIRVYGLDANYRFQTEDFTMAGQTAVVGTKTWMAVFGSEVILYGTGKVNAGVISIADAVVTWTTGTPSDLTKTFAQITTGQGVSHAGTYCIPEGERYCLTYVNISNRAQIVDYWALVQPLSSPISMIPLALLPATAPYQEINFPFGAMILNAKTWIRFQGTAQSTGGVGSLLAVLTRMPRGPA